MNLAGAVGEGAEVAGQHIALQLIRRPHARALCLVDGLSCLVLAGYWPLLYASPTRQAAVAPRPDLCNNWPQFKKLYTAQPNLALLWL